jgi:hypothetical protein
MLAAVSLPVVLALGLAACGDDEEPEESSEPTQGTNTAGAVTLNGQWPLTGEKLEGALPEHPVYVVKMDNSTSSAPQVGLEQADLIVEELVEGGITRLAVFYYQDLPDQVGPVRSVRASDIGIAKPAAGTLVASGGAKRTVGRVERAGITIVSEGAPGFSRDSARPAPYNVFVDLPELSKDPGKDWKAPSKTYFEFGDESEFSGDITVKKMRAVFSGGHTTEWKYTDEGWTRPNSNAKKGDDFVADNVLLLEVKVGDAGYRDPAGNPVPETFFAGKGKGVLVHGDSAERVTWRKALKQSQLKLFSQDGKPVTVPVGRTWVELVPAKDGTIALSK